MDRMDGVLIEHRTATAEEFWDILSPQKHLFRSPAGPCFVDKQATHGTLSRLYSDSKHIRCMTFFHSGQSRNSQKISYLRRFTLCGFSRNTVTLQVCVYRVILKSSGETSLIPRSNWIALSSIDKYGLHMTTLKLWRSRNTTRSLLAFLIGPAVLM